MALTHAEKQKRWIQNHPEYEANVRQRNRDFVENLKKDIPCSDCGVLFPSRVMDYHHTRDDKTSTITAMIYGKFSLEKIKQEIDKCILLCSNCHRLRHYDNRDI